MINKLILTFAELAASAWVGNVTGTMVTKSGNKLIDKCFIGTGATLVGSILVDSAVENLKRKLPTKPKTKEETKPEAEVKEETQNG